ncbi:MAG: hypothetical protein AAF696_28360, partial [Bacteroidota bacterium]
PEILAKVNSSFHIHEATGYYSSINIFNINIGLMRGSFKNEGKAEDLEMQCTMLLRFNHNSAKVLKNKSRLGASLGMHSYEYPKAAPPDN